jgi:hypothetical protein
LLAEPQAAWPRPEVMGELAKRVYSPPNQHLLEPSAPCNEDFRAAKDTPVTETQVHEITSNDVVTRLDAVASSVTE